MQRRRPSAFTRRLAGGKGLEGGRDNNGGAKQIWLYSKPRSDGWGKRACRLAEGSSMAKMSRGREEGEEVIGRECRWTNTKKAWHLSKIAPFLSLLHVHTFGCSGFRQVMRHEGAHALLPSSAWALAKRVVHGGWVDERDAKVARTARGRPAASSTAAPAAGFGRGPPVWYGKGVCMGAWTGE